MPEFVIDPRVAAQVAEHRYPLLFATISGAHLYGFPSPDSDFDIRGAHILPLHDALGLWPDKHDTVQVSGIRDGLEIDLVTHDLVARKLAGPEQSTLPEADVTFHESECQRLLSFPAASQTVGSRTRPIRADTERGNSTGRATGREHGSLGVRVRKMEDVGASRIQQRHHELSPEPGSDAGNLDRIASPGGVNTDTGQTGEVLVPNAPSAERPITTPSRI